MKAKKLLLILVPVTLLATGFYFKSQESGKSFLLPSILKSLETYHYNPPKIDDDFSKKVFDEFIGVLDANKRFFTKEDIEKLTILLRSWPRSALRSLLALPLHHQELLRLRYCRMMSGQMSAHRQFPGR